MEPMSRKTSAKTMKAGARSGGWQARSAASGRSFHRSSSDGSWRSRIVEPSVPRDSRSAAIRRAGSVVKTDATIADD